MAAANGKASQARSSEGQRNGIINCSNCNDRQTKTAVPLYESEQSEGKVEINLAELLFYTGTIARHCIF